MTDFLADWDFDLPEGAIATRPKGRRDSSRLMVLPRAGGEPIHHQFSDLPSLLREGDLLVVNNVRVMAARLRAERSTGGRVEVLLLGLGPGPIPCMCKPARRLKVGEVLTAPGGTLTIEALADEEGLLRVTASPSAQALMEQGGELPLPPYMNRSADEADTERYQTVFAGPLGASAAPTAGLHFTPELLQILGDMGVGIAEVTLNVGIGTFRPLRPEDVERGELHKETYTVPAGTAEAIARTRERGGRVIAVGTTSARTLESAWRNGAVQPGDDATTLFVRPPYEFQAIDGLITNFHLPRSSLLMLVSSLCSRERLLSAYREAVTEGYRFYSYGDAMLLL